MKTVRIYLLALAAVCAAAPAVSARDNSYDVLGKALMPFVNVFAERTKNPNHALSTTLVLEKMTGMPPELAGARVDLAVQAPDKLRVHGPVAGEELTICRNGQELWVYPGAKAEALLDAASADKKLPPPDPKYRLEPFRLPIPEKQLVFLPALFQVKDAGDEAVDGENCRVLQAQLMPQLARALKVEEWSARLWVRPDYRPARLLLTRGEWSASIKFESVDFQPSLPPATWKPSAEEAADVLKIPPARYNQLLRAIIGGAAK